MGGLVIRGGISHSALVCVVWGAIASTASAAELDFPLRNQPASLVRGLDGALAPVSARIPSSSSTPTPTQIAVADTVPSATVPTATVDGAVQLAQAGTPLPQRAQAQEIRGLVFVSDPAEIRSRGFQPVSGIDVSRAPLLAGADFSAIAEKFIGQPVTIEVLNGLVKEVVDYAKDHDAPVVNVLVPEQELRNGIVEILVIDSKVGKIVVEGNKWFANSDYTDAIRLAPGQPIRTNVLNADVAALNSNPFRSVDAVFSPGETPNTTDITLKANDRFPVRLYASLANDGTVSTGTEHGTVGFNWGDAFWIGHQLNYQYSHSLVDGKFQSHAGSYVIPLPWRDSLTLSASYSLTKSPIAGGVFDSNGKDLQLGLRYGIPLPKIAAFGGITNELHLGVDYKSSNSNLEFGGVSVFQSTPEVEQLAATYALGQNDKFGVTSVTTEGYLSPGNIAGANTTAAFQTARAGARADYVYGRATLERTNYLPYDFSGIVRVSGQVSNANLLSSEQFGITGSRGVRGFNEDVIINDEGYLTSLELRTPDIDPFHVVGIDRFNSQLQFLTFWDYGWARPVRFEAPGEKAHTAESVGVGFRYAIGSNLSARADYGFRIGPGESGLPRDNIAHFSVLVGY